MSLRCAEGCECGVLKDEALVLSKQKQRRGLDGLSGWFLYFGVVGAFQLCLDGFSNDLDVVLYSNGL